MRHLLSIADLTREDIERILDRAAAFEQIADREVKKVPALRGRTVLNLFYEASTRTRSSFELAAKRLSADVVNFAASGSSVEKGESLKDTVLTLGAHSPDAIVIRSPHAGAAALVAGWTSASVVNAGDGKHEHPTQALLDVHTLRSKLGGARRALDLDRRRHRAQPRRALEHPRLPGDGRARHARRPADAHAARHRGARLRRALRPRRPPRGRRRLRPARAARAHGRQGAAVAARVRRPLPDQRPPPAPAPGAHAPRPGEPRRGAVRRGRRLAAGRHHDAGPRRRRRPDGGPLRAAGRDARSTAPARMREPQPA